MFPGKKAGTKYSFSDPKEHCSEHVVTRPPTSVHKGKYPLTMAEYANIEHGEVLGERSSKIHHMSHKK